MFSIINHDPSRHTQLQKIIYDIKHRLRDDTMKVDRPQSKHRWWQAPVEPKSDQSMQLKELDAENSRLRRTIANLKCDKHFLLEEVRASSGLYQDH
jgi:hypothetical protein